VSLDVSFVTNAPGSCNGRVTRARHAGGMNTTITALLLAVALASGCADMPDHFVGAGASSANDGATTPKLRMPYPPQSSFDN
jgi:hypothetical protein